MTRYRELSTAFLTALGGEDGSVTLIEVCVAVIAVIILLWAFGEVPR